MRPCRDNWYLRRGPVSAIIVLSAAVGCAGQVFVSDPYTIGVALMQPYGCGVYITDILKGSPAESAGLRIGDRIRAVDGKRADTNDHTAQMLRGDGPDKVRVRIVRDEKEFQATAKREHLSEILLRAGRKMVSGVLVPDTFTGTWISGRVFPWGYPENTTRFYPGFELLIVPDAGRSTIDGLVIRGTLQVIVGDVASGGPAAQAGVRSGDTILSVNGVTPAGKSADELQQLFTSDRPETMRLQLKRGEEHLDAEFQLALPQQVARASGKLIVNAVAVPSWLTDGSAGCRPR